MSYISDFKSSVFNVFKQGTSVSTGTGDVVPEAVTYVGQAFSLNDGREVRLVSNGAATISAGRLVQSAATTSNHQNTSINVTTYTGAVGSTVIATTVGATAVNVNQYQGGYVLVNAGTGNGQTLRIASNTGVAASGVTTITLEDPIAVALDSTSKISLLSSPYQNVIVNPTTVTGTPVGVTLYPLTTAVAGVYTSAGALTTAPTYQFGFIVSKGIAACLSDASAPGVGKAICPSTVTAGSIMVKSPVTSTGDAEVGRTIVAATSAETRAVFIDL